MLEKGPYHLDGSWKKYAILLRLGRWVAFIYPFGNHHGPFHWKLYSQLPSGCRNKWDSLATCVLCYANYRLEETWSARQRLPSCDITSTHSTVDGSSQVATLHLLYAASNTWCLELSDIPNNSILFRNKRESWKMSRFHFFSASLFPLLVMQNYTARHP